MLESALLGFDDKCLLSDDVEVWCSGRRTGEQTERKQSCCANEFRGGTRSSKVSNESSMQNRLSLLTTSRCHHVSEMRYNGGSASIV